MNMRNVWLVFILLATPVLALAGPDPYNPGDRFLSKAQLAAHGPVTLKIGDIGVLLIRDITYHADPEHACVLNIPSFKTVVIDSWKSGGFDLNPGGVKFELKAQRGNGDETVQCFGAGSGCKVDTGIVKGFSK